MNVVTHKMQPLDITFFKSANVPKQQACSCQGMRRKLCRIFQVSAITCSLLNDCSENDAMHTASMA